MKILFKNNKAYLETYEGGYLKYKKLDNNQTLNIINKLKKQLTKKEA